MLTSPLGRIKIYADGICVDYEAEKYDFCRPPCKDRPAAGCYRIEVNGKYYRCVSCVLEPLAPVSVSDSSGETYVAAEFIKDHTILTIGAENENPSFEALFIENGLQYKLLQPVDQVVFGVAWATDYEGIEDVRTWYAADPTLK